MDVNKELDRTGFTPIPDAADAEHIKDGDSGGNGGGQ